MPLNPGEFQTGQESSPFAYLTRAKDFGVMVDKIMLPPPQINK